MSEPNGKDRKPADFLMEGLKPPTTLVWDSANLSKTWKSWKEEFTLYTDLTMPGAKKDNKSEVVYLPSQRERKGTFDHAGKWEDDC